MSFCTFTSTFLYFPLMSFESKWTGLFKGKKDDKKAQKSTDIIPDVYDQLEYSINLLCSRRDRLRSGGVVGKLDIVVV